MQKKKTMFMRCSRNKAAAQTDTTCVSGRRTDFIEHTCTASDMATVEILVGFQVT